MKHGKIPLGRDTAYPDNYTPELLFPIPRSKAREPLGLSGELPFTGVDFWNAWELTWLSGAGQPEIATAEIVVPADSPNIVESKSLKLYLNSFAMSRFSSRARSHRDLAERHWRLHRRRGRGQRIANRRFGNPWRFETRRHLA